jgi:hypothetical protein
MVGKVDKTIKNNKQLTNAVHKHRVFFLLIMIYAKIALVIFNSSISSLSGIGSAMVAKLAKLGISTLGQAAQYYPFRYR